MNIKKDNKGMSLVELMVAVGILSVIMLAIGYILSVMSQNFGQSQREVALQDSMQLTYSIVSDIVKSAQVVPVSETEHADAVYKSGNNYYILTETYNQEASLSEGVKVAAKAAKGHIISYDSSKKKLYLYTADYERTKGTTYEFNENDFNLKIANVNSTSVINKPENLLANNVKSFDIVTHLDEGYVVVNLELEYGGRTAAITQNVYLRNSNMAVQWADNSDEAETTPSVSVTPSVTAAPTATPIPGAKAELVGGVVISDPVKSQIVTSDTIDVNYESSMVEDPTGNVVVSQSSYKCVCGKVLVPAVEKHGWDDKYNILIPACGSSGCSYQYNGRGDYNSSSDTLSAAQCNTMNITKSTTSKRYRASGRIIIKNTSLSADYNNVEIVVYFESTGAKFKQMTPANAVTLDATNTTGKSKLTYNTSTIAGNGTYKYLKISIPTLNKAVQKGAGEYDYDQYVINYDWQATDGKVPVACTYYIKAN